MQHSDDSDTELLERARAGSAPAFAVLLYRHGPAVRAVVADHADPLRAMVGTFARAMRELPEPTEGAPRDRLIELAGAEVDRPRPPEPAVPLGPDELDAIWVELDQRWPDGKVPWSLPRWVGWSASIVVLAAMAVLVPHAVLTFGANGDEGPNEMAHLVARPFEGELDAAPPAEELEENLEPPPFEFPGVPPEPPPESDPEPDPEPDPATDEAP